MTFDPEEHEKNRQLYLETLLAAVEKHEREHPGKFNVIIASCEAEIVEASGLSRMVVRRISQELRELDLLGYHGNSGQEKGISYSLNVRGREVAEQVRYKKSALAKRRKAAAWVKEKLAELAGWAPRN
jgi:hypothetical protein